ncbi:hypothetical protein OPQ81_006179 [Rhizoctonia solani]|nr:hypothetical protein OPQ81_006179 [Rhizoctonia solani]
MAVHREYHPTCWCAHDLPLLGDENRANTPTQANPLPSSQTSKQPDRLDWYKNGIIQPKEYKIMIKNFDNFSMYFNGIIKCTIQAGNNPKPKTKKFLCKLLMSITNCSVVTSDIIDTHFPDFDDFTGEDDNHLDDQDNTKHDCGMELDPSGPDSDNLYNVPGRTWAVLDDELENGKVSCTMSTFMDILFKSIIF